MLDLGKMKRDHLLNAPSGVSHVSISKTELMNLIDENLGLRFALCRIAGFEPDTLGWGKPCCERGHEIASEALGKTQERAK